MLGRDRAGWTGARCSIDLRSLVRSPGFTLFVVLTLVLGIGANTAIFSVADAFIFKPVPFPDAERLVMLHERAPGNTTFSTPVAPADFLDFQSQTSSYEQVAAYNQVDFNLIPSWYLPAWSRPTSSTRSR